jgi:hypothetical protein
VDVIYESVCDLGGVWRTVLWARQAPAPFGAGSGSSPFFRKRRDVLADERRAAALDVNVDRVLIGASLRASKRPRATWPRLSAAALGWRSRTTPLLLLMLALLAMFNASNSMVLSILVVLPAAFRIWIVVLPKMPSPDEAAKR